MFATMFLGVVLGVFLTMGVVRGDAERGLLQPLLVRPLSRSQLLLGRLLAAAAVCTVYVACVYTALMLVTGLIGDWWPDRIVAARHRARSRRLDHRRRVPARARSSSRRPRTGSPSSWSSASGLVAGLLGSDRAGTRSGTLKTAAHAVSWALPFEALYQDGLHAITENTAFAGFILRLGPFGGANAAGPWLGPWVAAYAVVVAALALTGFARRDL